MQQVKAYSDDNFPTTRPTRAGVEKMGADGSLVRATRNSKGGLGWVLLFAGSVLGIVHAVTDTLPSVAASSDKHTITAQGNGSLSTVNGGIGGRTSWAVNDRLLITANADPTLTGVFRVVDVGGAGAPFILSRANDARTAENMPHGRSFVVKGGNRQGDVFVNNTSTGPVAPEPGVDQFTFTGTGNFGAGFSDLYANQFYEVLEVGPMVCVRLNVTAGAGAGDVEVFNAGSNPVKGAPKALELVSASMIVTAAGAGASSMQARSAAAGAGDALSGPILTDALGKALEGAGGSIVANPTVAQGGILFLRFSDRAAAGRVHLVFRVA